MARAGGAAGLAAPSPLGSALVGLLVGRDLVDQENHDTFDVAFVVRVGPLLWPSQLVTR